MVDREDVRDADFIDAVELASDGTASYKTSPVTSVVSGTVTVNPSADYLGLVFGDDPIEAGDTFVLSGATAGNGTYTILAVTDNTQFTVVGAIVDSTGGSADFRHPAGALHVGVDPTNISSSAATDVQNVLEDLDASIAAGGITAAQHKTLRQLIHLADDDGPMEGFTSGAFEETLPANSAFPTSVIWWESSSKLKKYVETTITYDGAFFSTVVYRAYDTDGTTVLVTLTDTYDYSPGRLTPTRTRTWV